MSSTAPEMGLIAPETGLMALYTQQQPASPNQGHLSAAELRHEEQMGIDSMLFPAFSSEPLPLSAYKGKKMVRSFFHICKFH